jgi:hypothetical protein
MDRLSPEEPVRALATEPLEVLRQPVDLPLVSVGILPQEPPPDEDSTVLGNVQHGVAQTLHLLDRYHHAIAIMAVNYPITDPGIQPTGLAGDRTDEQLSSDPRP